MDRVSVSDTDTLSGVRAVISFFAHEIAMQTIARQSMYYPLRTVIRISEVRRTWGASCRKRAGCVIPEHLEGRKRGSWAI